MIRTRTLTALFVLLLALGCDEHSTSKSSTARVAKQAAPKVGLAAVRDRGVLRVLTRNNGISYFVLRGKSMGFDYELAQRFAQYLGVQLQLVVPADWGDLIPMVQRGEGDVIAAGMDITPQRQKEVLFAKPYALMPMRVVWGRGQKPVHSLEDLSGKSVHVRLHSSYYQRLDALNSLFQSAGRAPIDIVIESESLETEDILADVAAGRIPYSVCDQHICMENKWYLPNLVVGPAISDPEPLAWAVNSKAVGLANAISAFFARLKNQGDFETIYKRYYQDPRVLAAQTRDALYVDKTGHISPFDAALKAAGNKFHVDWRLLAALAYQESHFDPKARAWGGGRGLFGMLPSTARKLDVTNLYDPGPAAMAAAEHLATMRYQFAQLPDVDSQWHMALAAYHAGANHIVDARLIASQKHLDPDKWDSVARVLPLLSKHSYTTQAKHGYLRGAATVVFVEQIWSRYRSYCHATGERDQANLGPTTHGSTSP